MVSVTREKHKPRASGITKLSGFAVGLSLSLSPIANMYLINDVNFVECNFTCGHVTQYHGYFIQVGISS